MLLVRQIALRRTSSLKVGFRINTKLQKSFWNSNKLAICMQRMETTENATLMRHFASVSEEKDGLQQCEKNETQGTEDKASDEQLSKSALKKLAKAAKNGKEKKEKQQWNTEGKTAVKKEVIVADDQQEQLAKLLAATKPGEKKDFSSSMAEKYDPMLVEATWDLYWEKQGYYHVSAEEVGKTKPEDRFIMVIPPPNVTGTLHIGHALMVTIQDTLCRFHRMCGKKVLWIPGTDHAGIGTQAVVEAKIWKEEKKTRHDYGREKFLEKVWEFKEEKGGIILNQIRRMGVSVDHSRTVFTMDEVRSKAVAEAFIRMFDMGLIYRKTRLVNWSSKLNTAIADIEVDNMELEGKTMLKVKGHDEKKKYEFGVLTQFSYPIADEDGNPTDEKLTVATTRLETMLGDTAVAIHPKDSRYLHLHGKKVVHPFFNRLLPIILDSELVDMSFGTACVKITPAHDENDYNCGVRHNLPMINILDDDGRIDISECLVGAPENCIGKQFHGLMRYDARVAIEKALDSLGLLGEKKDNKMVLPICSKSGDIIEPRLKEQWFVDTNEMSANAIKAVKDGSLKLVPDFHNDTWFRFLTDPHQWCISRQLWWGHRIPAYECFATLEDGSSKALGWVAASSDAAAVKLAEKKLGASKATSIEVKQDDDVLDTWFSSGIFPFSVFGWPDESKDLDVFFPNTFLETGHDILFFWVARMVMMSQTLMGGRLPFDTVYLHAIVRDRYGRKMSKSLGNIIDPLAVINGCSLNVLNQTILNSNLPEKEIKKAIKGQEQEYPDGIPQCGSDALRFGLLSSISQGRDVNLDINNIFSTRKFCNKLWQVTRFSIMTCGEDLTPIPNFLENLPKYSDKLSHRDKWILSELAGLVQTCNEKMESFYFSELTQALMSFWTSNLCDVYVESIKPVTRTDDDVAGKLARNVLLLCLDVGLRLMHPIMPFVTEELWHNLPGNKVRLLNAQPKEHQSIMVASYPRSNMFTAVTKDTSYQVSCEAFILAQKVAKAMRSLKSDYNITKKDVQFTVFVDDLRHKLLTDVILDMNTLGNGEITLLTESELAISSKEKGMVGTVIDGGLQVFLQLKGSVDVSQQVKRLEKELNTTQNNFDTIEKKLTNEKFVANAPEQILEENKAKMTELATQLEKIKLQISQFKDL